MNPQESFVASEPQAANAGFCQQCGMPLTEESRRTVAGAVFCEPCLEARVAGAPPVGPASPYAPWSPGAVPLPSAPNPALAAVLGFIPGVGAMYNEQYAKGIAHLTIFALLIVLTDANGIFGLFIAGWEFYMAIEAYHTARARRDGTPLPNPFGFNDLGERLGIGKGWTTPTPIPGTTRAYPAADPQPEATANASQPFNWSPVASSQSPLSAAGTAYPANAWSTPYQAVPQPYAEPISTPIEPLPPILPVTPLARFPAGAVWLILLGILFLLSTTGIFREFSGEALLGWGFIGLAGWLFLHRYKELALVEPSIPGRIVRSFQGSIWLLTSGILALLDSFVVLGWSRSWPIYIIVGGVMLLLNRLSTASRVMPAVAIPVNPAQVPSEPGSGK